VHHPRIDVGFPVGTSPPVGRWRAIVRLAAAIGIESLWLVDHLAGFFAPAVWSPSFSWLAKAKPVDPWFDWRVAAGALAGRAGRLQLGVGVTDPIRHHPVVLAQAALTLSHLTRRPPILGMGAGEAANLVPYGFSFERPVARFEEAVQVVRLCLDGAGPRSFEGEFYSLDRAGFDLVAGQGGKPQLWVAAHGRRMLRLAGEYGDGWYPGVPMSPEEYAVSLAAVRGAAMTAGRNPAAIVPSMQLFYLAARNDADLQRHLGHPAIRYLGLLAPHTMWRAVGRRHPLGENHRGYLDIVPSRYTAEEIEDAIAQVPESLVTTQVAIGTPDDVVRQVRALAEAGLRSVVLAPVAPVVSRRSLAFTTRTLPGIVRRLRTGEG
jgi:phthiodiolone/phenolphthiodiolone dimycocerosates ketoreductase